jgi:hypothetical protein
LDAQTALQQAQLETQQQEIGAGLELERFGLESEAAAKRREQNVGLGREVIGGSFNVLSSLLSAPFSSDIRLKKDIEDGDEETRRFLDSLKPSTFTRTDDGVRRTGIMAQDLETTPAGAASVMETPQGKQVDAAELTGTQLAALGNLNERIKAIEEGRTGQAQEFRESELGQLARTGQEVRREAKGIRLEEGPELQQVAILNERLRKLEEAIPGFTGLSVDELSERAKLQRAQRIVSEKAMPEEARRAPSDVEALRLAERAPVQAPTTGAARQPGLQLPPTRGEDVAAESRIGQIAAQPVVTGQAPFTRAPGVPQTFQPEPLMDVPGLTAPPPSNPFETAAEIEAEERIEDEFLARQAQRRRSMLGGLV